MRIAHLTGNITCNSQIVLCTAYVHVHMYTYIIHNYTYYVLYLYVCDYVCDHDHSYVLARSQSHCIVSIVKKET